MVNDNLAKFVKAATENIQEHLKLYIETDGGDEAYRRDMSPQGGDPKTKTLVLKTVGRKSGRDVLAPLIFNTWGDDLIVVASKGGSDQSPAWYLNLVANPEVVVQVRDKRYRCTARVAEGDERAKLWRFMAGYYPPYLEYQARTSRKIPVVVLTPGEEVAQKFVWHEGEGVDAAMRGK